MANKVLDAIRKNFLGSQKGSKDMKKEDKQPVETVASEELATQLKQAQETLASQTATIEAVQATMQELTEKLMASESALQEAKKALEDQETEKAALLAEAKQKQMVARKQKVIEAVGDNERAAKMLAATEGMEDAQFEAVVGALAGSMEKEETSVMFKEVGVDGNVAADKVENDGSSLMKALQQKYQAK